MGTVIESKDIYLVNALQRGDQKAFECLFKRYYPMLCAYAHRFVEQEDAEEIVQEIMLWLWENRTELNIRQSVSQYLFKMTYNRTLNLITRKEIASRAETYFHSQYQEIPESINYYQIEELTLRIEEAIAALPESYRAAFIAHRFKGLSYKEIAEMYQVSPKTIDYRIQQALKILRIRLKDYLPLVMALFPLNQC